jgi:hypothetical protein
MHMADSESKKSVRPKEPAPTTKKAAKKTVAVTKKPVKAKTGNPAKPAEKPVVKRPNNNRKVRDNYTMPSTDYALLTGLKKACQQAGLQAKKGEILRAGLHLLANQTTDALVNAVREIQQA